MKPNDVFIAGTGKGGLLLCQATAVRDNIIAARVINGAWSLVFTDGVATRHANLRIAYTGPVPKGDYNDILGWYEENEASLAGQVDLSLPPPPDKSKGHYRVRHARDVVICYTVDEVYQAIGKLPFGAGYTVESDEFDTTEFIPF